MAGTASNFSSNIDLGLSASPQGVYDPLSDTDMTSHFNATQTLSQVVSDISTLRVLFLVGVSAGKFIQLNNTGGTEAIGTVCSLGNKPVGFLTQDVAPGEYAVVTTKGINRNLSGLAPGSTYYNIGNGDVANTGAGLQYYVGVALSSTELLVTDVFKV